MQKTITLVLVIVVVVVVAAVHLMMLYSRGTALRRIEEEHEELHEHMLATKDGIPPLQLLPGTKVYRSDADTITFSFDGGWSRPEGYETISDYLLDVSETKWTGIAAREEHFATRVSDVVWHFARHIRDAFPGHARAYRYERFEQVRNRSATAAVYFRHGVVFVTGAYGYDKGDRDRIGDLIRVTVWRLHRSGPRRVPHGTVTPKKP